MPTRDTTHHPAAALSKLRSRWFAPSRPLAVDDEPRWSPAPDTTGDHARPDGELERPSASAPAP